MPKHLLSVVFLLSLLGCVHQQSEQRTSNVSEAQIEAWLASGAEENMPALFAALDENGDSWLDEDEVRSDPQWLKNADADANENVSIIEFMMSSDAAFGRGSANPRACVRNRGTRAITWELKSGNKSVKVLPEQKSQEWTCERVKEQTDYEFRVALKDDPFFSYNCYIPIRGFEWVEASDVAKSEIPIECSHRIDSVVMDDVLVRPFGYKGEAIVRGKASFGGPIEAGDILIYDMKKKLIREERTGTSKDGAFLVRLPEAIPGGFIAEVTGGNINGKAFVETLTTRVSNFDYVKGIVQVTPLAHVAAAYAGRHPELSSEDAETKVKHALAIENADELNVQRLLAEAGKGGGFSAYVASLVDKIEKGESLDAKLGKKK